MREFLLSFPVTYCIIKRCVVLFNISFYTLRSVPRNYVDFIYQFPERIFHVHMKDVYWSDTPKQVGIFGGHVTFGDPRRYWNFRSLGRGKINFEEIIRALNSIGYQGPLSVEWEDSAMDREHGARESCELVKRVDFQPSAHAFDACFGKE